MDSLNLCILSGYLERDPTVRYREDGTAHCTCTLWVEEHREDTCFRTYVLCEAYGKTGEALAALHGGAVVLLQGKLFWRKQVTASGAEKSGHALLVQKVSPLVPTPTLSGSSN
jgi:single-stranded DNA-binding protein